MNRTKFAFVAPTALHDRVGRLAEDRYMSRSAVIRQALAVGLEKLERAGLAGDLVTMDAGKGGSR